MTSAKTADYHAEVEKSVAWWPRVLLALLVLLVLLLALPRQAGSDLVWKGLRHETLGPKETQSQEPGPWFVQGAWLGRVSASGETQTVRPLEEGWIAEATGVARFDSQSVRLNLDPLNPLAQPFSWPGPFVTWRRGVAFVLDPYRQSLSEYQAHSPLWKRDFSSLITALDASRTLRVVGLLEGRVEILEQNGQAWNPYIPGGSRLSVLFNLALNDEADRLTVVSGLDPKRWTLLEAEGRSFRPVWQGVLEDSSRESGLLGFLGRDWMYAQTDQGLRLLRLANRRHLDFALEGRPLGVAWNPELKIFSLWSRLGPQLRWTALGDQGQPLAQWTLQDGSPERAWQSFGGSDRLLWFRDDRLLVTGWVWQ